MERAMWVRTPIALGYTRGHFTALVPMEPVEPEAAGAVGGTRAPTDECVYYPLVDADGTALPVHFLPSIEAQHPFAILPDRNNKQESVLREFLDCFVTESGILVARVPLPPRPPLIRDMLDLWLDAYRRPLAVSGSPALPPPAFSPSVNKFAPAKVAVRPSQVRPLFTLQNSKIFLPTRASFFSAPH